MTQQGYFDIFYKRYCELIEEMREEYMPIIDLFQEIDVINKLNELTMEEIAKIYASMEYAKVKYHGENTVEFITGGWSENEYFLDCLQDFRSKHHDNYIGYLRGGSQWFIIDKDKESDYHHDIVEFKKRDDNDKTEKPTKIIHKEISNCHGCPYYEQVDCYGCSVICRHNDRVIKDRHEFKDSLLFKYCPLDDIET